MKVIKFPQHRTKNGTKYLVPMDIKSPKLLLFTFLLNLASWFIIAIIVGLLASRMLTY